MNGPISARRPFAGLLGLLAALATALLLVPAVASADEPQDTIDVAIGQVNQIAQEAGVDPAQVLEAEIDLELEPGQTTRVTLRDVLLRLAGRSVIDSRNSTGLAGTGQLNAGGTFHIAASLQLEAVPSGTTDATWPNLPPGPDMRPYDVRVSDYSPTTPIVPGVNPLFLAAALAGVDWPEAVSDVAPGLDDPILLLHPGGKLTSVQGSDWNVLGVHGAGSYGLGHNLDTGDRRHIEDDPWPVWLPFLTGELMVPDEEIDFLGFGIVVNTSTCSPVRASSNPSSPLYTIIIARACVGAGTIIGDGVAQFNGGSPVDFRNDLAPLWEEAAPEIKALIEAVDGVIESIPVGDVLEIVLGLVGDVDLPTDAAGGSSTSSTSSSDPVEATVEVVVQTTQAVINTTTTSVKRLLGR